MRLFSFDFNALSYPQNAIVQQFFAYKLAKRLRGRTFEWIGELGCGGGELLRALLANEVRFEKYQGCDISEKMLGNFPISLRNRNCEILLEDFDHFLKKGQKFSLICSSSALQWSANLEHTFSQIALHCKEVALCLFDRQTLSSLHAFLGTSSPLLEFEEIREIFLQYFQGEIFLSRAELKFQNPSQALLHLKKSGVLGGGNLRYSQAKKMLEFRGKIEYESVFLWGRSKYKEE